MRMLVLSVSVLACLGTACAIAQSDDWGPAQDQIPPYRTHIDRRHGNDHAYPDRGAVVRDLPPGAAEVNYAGISYRFVGGIWYQREGPAYLVVEPPIGVIVPQLPAFATHFDSDGKPYLYANDVFYRPRPDLGGYEVVNDPQDADAASVAAPAQASAGQPIVVASAPATLPSPQTNPTGVAIQPRNGQSADRQAIDRYECYQVAVRQTGFDPLASSDGTPPADVARRDSDYSRAQATCLEGRGYTVAR